MAELKTFLFTDLVGSVDLKREMPGRSDTERDRAFIEQILLPHRQRIEQDLVGHGGRVVSTAGDGHFLVFTDTILAARWAVAVQTSHIDEPLSTQRGTRVDVRMSMHVGIPQQDPRDENNFVGKPIDYASRLCDYAAGGQILASRSVVAILEDAGVDGIQFHQHGQRELKGIGIVEVYELVRTGQSPRPLQKRPRGDRSRQWTVLPVTIGASEMYGLPAREQAARGATLTRHRLGNYELGELLGTGGMGDVYQARHVQFGRIRAIKVIKPSLVAAGHQEIIRRFYQEIKAVGALEHPNIVVAIESSAPTDSVHYLVMEYVEGVAADQLVEAHGPLAAADACEIARQTARGLQYIHQHGMVHRDVKPSNLILTVLDVPHAGDDTSGREEKPREQGLVKILDLGLALLVGDDGQRLTRFDDRAMGTGMYMSPEQWESTSVDIRADIYSLGCTLYHLLAGKPPYAESDLRPQRAHERLPLPPIDPPVALPRGLWEILRRATAKKPADRYTTPGELAEALSPFCQGSDLPLLAREYRQKTKPTAPTRPRAGSDTLSPSRAESETLPGWKPYRSKWKSWSKPEANRRIWWSVVAVALLACVAIGSWFAIRAATGQFREDHLLLAADYASSQIRDDIERRFEILERLADNSRLRSDLQSIHDNPEDISQWASLEDWLGARKAQYESEAPSDSWFVNDFRGVQVARSPPSDSSRGRSYAHRDYFHGRGADLSEDTAFVPERVGEVVPDGVTEVRPIEAPHLSTVYLSTSTGRLRVAFSVPVWNDASLPSQRMVLGVIAMSVDLGEFNVLETKLRAGQAVVLIDLRSDAIEGEPLRGLILHHQSIDPSTHTASPLRLSEGLLQQVEAAVSSARPASEERARLIRPYREPGVESGRVMWGAIKPVVYRYEGEEIFTGWVVLVQEPSGG